MAPLSKPVYQMVMLHLDLGAQWTEPGVIVLSKAFDEGSFVRWLFKGISKYIFHTEFKLIV